MTSKTTNKFSPEVRERAVRMVGKVVGNKYLLNPGRGRPVRVGY